jgi:hypothetical protein
LAQQEEKGNDFSLPHLAKVRHLKPFAVTLSGEQHAPPAGEFCPVAIMLASLHRLAGSQEHGVLAVFSVQLIDGGIDAAHTLGPQYLSKQIELAFSFPVQIGENDASGAVILSGTAQQVQMLVDEWHNGAEHIGGPGQHQLVTCMPVALGAHQKEHTSGF